jgi:lipoic acid synthetase
MVSLGRDIPPHLAHLAKDIAAADEGFAQAV